ncbi:TRAP transporter large permease subunit [Prosthecochloris sp. N3]|uniref:TRAP transporter large permease subunit n=1 Tax=Prosthecochloris ethylica TaxID=2743976 RepID=A0ABR9XSK8_9CHLB|nr:TRAP transporter large permease subunit [Prosthecochloris ethylica]MBF0586834.1 TRAP transporter large permease subunit [Prosthecochloris ethylica]MBF0636818.1 TRAP transporter large permease subunit [Prosthecochloris ethylica]NUK48034.1 TRAP transporter large permease subunit [Prosthecochloris ethylica]
MSEFLPFIMFAAVFVLLLVGYPVALTLGGVSVVFGLFTFGPDFFALLPMRLWGTMTNYVLMAVPLFIFMGVMLEKSGIAEKLLETMGLLFGRFRGGLALSVIIVGALLAASTGIVGATVVTMGLMSLPAMLKRGYQPELATGTIAASGTLGQIIPPSIVLVLLGSILNVSVGDMFIGAMIPGVLLVTAYVLYIIVMSVLQPSSMPSIPADELTAFARNRPWKTILEAFVIPLLLVLAVLGSIFAGIASPTEAAAIGAFGAMLLTLFQRKLSMSVLRSVMKETTYLTSMVFIILAGASAFSLVFRGMHGDRILADLITQANFQPELFLAIVMIGVFIAGFFIDFIEIIFIIVPVVAPVFSAFGVDLLWIGVLLAMNLQASFLTPPFGFSLFYLKGVSPREVTTGHLYRGIIPFIVIQLVMLVMIILFPEIVTWLPEQLTGR